MKILLFLLIPVIIFSQTPDYPDTLYLKTGQAHPCLIMELNENLINIIYKKDMFSSTRLSLVDKIYMENFQIIYANAQFITGFEMIMKFLSKRNIEAQNKKEQVNNITEKFSEENKFSFGVIYMPFFSAEQYFYIPPSAFNPPIVYIIGDIKSSFESQFAYLVIPNLQIAFDLGYHSTYMKRRNEEHSTYDDSGSESVADMQLYNFYIGLKYYFSEIMDNKVSAYFQAGLGKQFAIVDNMQRNLYFTSAITSTNNENEYLEDLNSPFSFYLGFGAEYFFNNSLSLSADLRFLYSSISGSYKYQEGNQSYQYTRIEKTEESDLIKRVGLGINFYF